MLFKLTSCFYYCLFFDFKLQQFQMQYILHDGLEFGAVTSYCIFIFTLYSRFSLSQLLETFIFTFTSFDELELHIITYSTRLCVVTHYLTELSYLDRVL